MERTAYDPCWFLRFPGRAARDEAGMGSWGAAVGFRELWVPREPAKLREILWSFLWKSCGQICFCTRVSGAALKHQDAGIGD